MDGVGQLVRLEAAGELRKQWAGHVARQGSSLGNAVDQTLLSTLSLHLPLLCGLCVLPPSHLPLHHPNLPLVKKLMLIQTKGYMTTKASCTLFFLYILSQ